MRKLIIGKNSNLVKNLIEFEDIHIDVLSHREITKCALNNYDFIFLFSWDHSDRYANQKIIDLIPPEKLVFISTTAVFSNLVRNQWARYPIDKEYIERVVLQRGGYVVRFGVCNENLLDQYYGYVPVTSNKMIAEFINQFSGEKLITNLFNIQNGNLSGWRKDLAKLNYLTSRFLPNKLIFQVIFLVIAKIFKFSNYSYSGDSCFLFSEKLQVGFGALGGYYYKKSNKINKNCNVIVSDRNNIKYNLMGFVDTYFPWSSLGLSKLWHGVYHKIINENFSQKKIKFIGKSFNLRNNFLKGYVESIQFDNEFCEVKVLKKDGSEYRIFTKTLILAAGAIDNIRILSDLANQPCRMSDHELALFGSVDSKDVANNLIKKYFGVIKYNSSISHTSSKFKILFDLRPYVAAKDSENLSFYNRSSAAIILNLINKFSLSRINEAFYNRFKFGIATKKYHLYVQVLNQDCIKYDKGLLSRDRLNEDDWELVANAVREIFPEYKPARVIRSIDAQHVWGGKELLENKLIKNLVKDGKLVIVGSPSYLELNQYHHTVNFRYHN